MRRKHEDILGFNVEQTGPGIQSLSDLEFGYLIRGINPFQQLCDADKTDLLVLASRLRKISKFVSQCGETSKELDLKLNNLVQARNQHAEGLLEVQKFATSMHSSLIVNLETTQRNLAERICDFVESKVPCVRAIRHRD